MPWSIFSDGGGQGTALTWAEDLLTEIGAPVSPGNEQFIYDWEVSEGGGGKFNPLNQGPVPGHPELTSTGEQFGGGAADFVSWEAGLQGAADYLAMSAYSDIRGALIAGQPEQARAALIDSPWAASHYGPAGRPGANFSDAALPGKASALPGLGSGLGLNPLDWPGKIAQAAVSGILPGVETFAIVAPVVAAAAAVGVLGLYLMTKGPRQRVEERTEERAGQAAQVAAVVA